ncbi:MAG: ABC-F family ATP-binding cassette domain-containing protein, partial [Clostridia bacterium]|nr:ABC-F family ATP-binding cassette domain-containing protein [Clostridia bacterium]
MPASSRRYPFVGFTPTREPGKDILAVNNISKVGEDGLPLLQDVSFRLDKGDKVAFLSENPLAVTELFKIIMEESQPDAGAFKWGNTVSVSYFPKDNGDFFEDVDLNLIEWMRQYTTTEDTETFLRGFLGRMLFSGDEVYKPAKVLSGGERVRCMLSRMMLFGSNALVLDQPTNHLDLESITAVNNGLRDFKGIVLFTSHDHEFIQTIANRIIEITPTGVIDRRCTYDEYLEMKAQKKF